MRGFALEVSKAGGRVGEKEHGMWKCLQENTLRSQVLHQPVQQLQLSDIPYCLVQLPFLLIAKHTLEHLTHAASPFHCSCRELKELPEKAKESRVSPR